MSGNGHDTLRLWLRLFNTTTRMEQVIGKALARDFGSSLPRFDLLSQLHRHPAGLRMGELSTLTLTSNGNVTHLVRALEKDGLVRRRIPSADRRTAVVRLTAAGRRHFESMAAAHERIVISLFDALPPARQRALHAQLGVLREQFRPSRNPR